MEINFNSKFRITNYRLDANKYTIVNNGWSCNKHWAKELNIELLKFKNVLIKKYNSELYEDYVFLFKNQEDASRALEWLELLSIAFKLIS
jgi:hypothetical protein